MNDQRSLSPFLDKSGQIDATRRNLPHWHQEGKLQFVTFHLADSVPTDTIREIMERREDWLEEHPRPWNIQTEIEYHRLFSLRIDEWLDNGHGSCVLRDKSCATVVQDALMFFNGKRYLLHSFVVMPNHVHVLLELFFGQKLSEITHSWKSFTAKKINHIVGGSGQLWHHESWDRIIRNEQHYLRVKAYIRKNYDHGGVLYFDL